MCQRDVKGLYLFCMAGYSCVLHREGLRFTRHYAGSTVCAPSRCVLMTGLHTGHCTVRGNAPSLLEDEDVTAAEVLKQAGYVTGCFGKWGIGNPPPRDDPNRQGFDEFYGYVMIFMMVARVCP